MSPLTSFSQGLIPTLPPASLTKTSRKEKYNAATPPTPPDAEHGTDTSPPPQDAIPHKHHPLLLPGLIAIQLLTQASFGATLIPLPLLAATFSTHPTTWALRAWVPAAYALTVGTCVLAAGRLGDIHGHRKLILLGWAWFGLSSAACGFAAFAPRAPTLFIVCRALQGVGPAVLLANGLAVLGREFSAERDAVRRGWVSREMAFALFGCTAPMGCGIGGLVGGALARWAWWPWFFWGQGVACAVLLLVAKVSVPLEEPECAGESMDWVGAVLGVGGLICANVAWNEAPEVGWAKPHVLVLLVVGVLCLVVFGWWERRATHPLLPPGIMNAAATSIAICVAIGWAAFAAWMYYTYQFLWYVRGIPIYDGALQFIPLVISGVTAAIVTGYLLSRIHSSWVMVAAMVAFTAGCLLSVTAPAKQTFWANIFVSMVVMPWGMDMSFPASTLILSNVFPKAHQGVAASLINTIVNYSISIGLGIAGTVESQVNRNGQDLERGYRAALWTSLGLAGLGVIISLAFALARSQKLIDGL